MSSATSGTAGTRAIGAPSFGDTIGDGEFATSEMLGKLASLGLLGSSGPGSLDLSGLVAGEDLGLASLVGVGRLDSLVVGLWPGLTLGIVRLGEVTSVLGVAAFRICGGLASEGASPARESYGPAVLGRGGMAGRRTGLTGAPESPAALVRVAVDGAAVGPDALDAPDAVRIARGGENSMADPGLGREASIAEPGRDIAAL